MVGDTNAAYVIMNDPANPQYENTKTSHYEDLVFDWKMPCGPSKATWAKRKLMIFVIVAVAMFIVGAVTAGGVGWHIGSSEYHLR